MLGINVAESNGNLVIKWQLSKFEIPLSEIIEVTHDETYAGLEKEAIRIGTPYGTTDRIVIRTKSKVYILFTTNAFSIKDQINGLLN